MAFTFTLKIAQNFRQTSQENFVNPPLIGDKTDKPYKPSMAACISLTYIKYEDP